MLVALVIIGVTTSNQKHTVRVVSPAPLTVPAPTVPPTMSTPPTAPATTPPPQPQTIYTLSGIGNKDSTSFEVPTADWKLEYSYDCSNLGSAGKFRVDLYSDGVTNNPYVNEFGTGKADSATVHDGPATYVLSINSECNWTIVVVTWP